LGCRGSQMAQPHGIPSEAVRSLDHEMPRPQIGDVGAVVSLAKSEGWVWNIAVAGIDDHHCDVREIGSMIALTRVFSCAGRGAMFCKESTTLDLRARSTGEPGAV